VRADSSAFVADRELIDALAARSQPLDRDQDLTLFCQGDAPAGIYILHHGEATLTMRSPQGAVILCILCFQTAAGSLLGLPGVIANEPYSLTAVARKGAEVSFVARDDFAALMHSEPLLSLKVLQVLAAEVRSARLALIAA